jgi:hypothetical protein
MASVLSDRYIVVQTLMYRFFILLSMIVSRDISERFFRIPGFRLLLYDIWFFRRRFANFIIESFGPRVLDPLSLAALTAIVPICPLMLRSIALTDGLVILLTNIVRAFPFGLFDGRSCPMGPACVGPWGCGIRGHFGLIGIHSLCNSESKLY